MTTFDIRLAQMSDAVRIAAISRDHIEYGLGWRYQQAEIRQKIGHPETNVIVALHDGKLAGFAIMEYAGFEAHLILFAVLPEYRRQRAGTALLHWLIRTAEVSGAQTIFVEMRKANAAGRRFYESIGLKPMEQLHQYYRRNEDGMRMALDLRHPCEPGTDQPS